MATARTTLDLLDSSGESPSFDAALSRHGLGVLRAEPDVSWLQVNLGKLCNQACHHCHVDAGPNRTENMDERTVQRVMELMANTPSIGLVDVTGGAPEMNPHFRELVRFARGRGVRVIDRCNLTVLFEPGHEDTAQFLAEQGVEVVASLPCYLEDNVDKQRGGGVFEKSIRGIQLLNSLGYGVEGSGLKLDLVYNPVGAHLPPAQAGLEADYKQRLGDAFGLQFTNLITITNMPIARFRHDLVRSGRLGDYEQLLLDSFNVATVEGLMCRSLVSVSWDGRLYDCDFNQMLEIDLLEEVGHSTLWDLESFTDLASRAIATDAHCFGCTAGAGSSCGGTIE